jgi:hydrogenase-4 component F
VTVPLVLAPLIAAAAALAAPSNRWRPLILPLGGAAHLALLARDTLAGAPPPPGAWVGLDPLGRLVLGLVSVLFLFAALYAVGYLRRESHRDNRVFCCCMLLFLTTMTVLACSQHWGLMWVALEATTLASAPLIYFDRSALALEATWKYLLICSVGIAIALLGTFFLAYSSLHAGLRTTLVAGDMLAAAPSLSTAWLDAAFVLLLVGYGTKAGLAPMHTWLPDAHGQAPAPVSALLSGALLPCAFLPLLRLYQLCAAAGRVSVVQPVFLAVGLLSIAIGGAFVLRQRDLKRMLAFSSVEQMGVLALGLGVGGGGLFGALLHMINTGLTKGMLFLCAGNVLLACGSKSAGEVSGLMRRLPLTGALLVAGLLAITGSPPFGPFVSELTILSAALGGGHFVAGAGFLVLLAVVFMGMGATVLSVTQGPADARATRPARETGAMSLVGLIVLVLLLGTYIPDPLRALLAEAAGLLEGPR